MDRWVMDNATLVRRVDVSESVARFLVRPDDGPAPFEPGQYLTLGLPEVDGRLLQRPYSTAARRGAAGEHEFLIRRVHGGALTPLLWQARVGHRLRIGRPKGLFTLLPDDARTHLFVASGTGLAPFISMLETLITIGRPPRSIVVHGVSHERELAYRDRLERWQRDGIVSYVPSISRPDDPSNAGWQGHRGRVGTILDEVCGELAVDPLATVAYLCGNPEMILAGERVLVERGFGRGSIRSEHYWPISPRRPSAAPG